MIRKKILILAENLDIQITSSSRRTSKIAVALSNDFEVSILYTPLHSSNFKWLPHITMIPLEPFETADGAAFTLKDKINSRITGFSFKEHKRIKVWKEGIVEALSKTPYDAIFSLASGVDYYTHHALNFVDTQIPLISYYHDPYPWMYYPKTYRKTEAKIIQKQKASSLNKILNKSKANLFPSKKLADLFEKNYAFNANTIVVAPHLLQELNDIYQWNSGAEYALDPSVFNITYAGSLHPSRKIETLLHAYEQFLGEIDAACSVCLNFVGPLGEYEPLVKKYRDQLPHEIHVFGRVGYDKSLELMKNSQVTVIIEADDIESPFLPGKFPDYVQANRPIIHIGPLDSEVMRLLGKDYENAVRHGQVEELTSVLRRLLKTFTEQGVLSLSRPDLEAYLSPEALNNQINLILE